MRYCRFQFNGGAEYGLVESVAGKDAITCLLLTPPEEATDSKNIPSRAITPIPFSEAAIVAPVRPSKIVCVGRNYKEHAAEMGKDVPAEPLLFLKRPSALLDPGRTILRPKVSQRTDYEGELGVIIAKLCHKLSPSEDVRPYILGYTVVNDFTARDLQRKDPQWTRGKGYDTFCPVGPLVNDEIDPWKGVTVETRVNGQVKQQGDLAQQIWNVQEQIAYLSRLVTLQPGDLIFTGTPAGVGPVKAGDKLEGHVDGVGELAVTYR